jgi:protein-disulfide isomerase
MAAAERVVAGMVSRRTFALGAASILALPGAAYATGPDAMTIGARSARLQLVEYASLTCPHCAAFHAANWHALKSEYIDAGRVWFTLRELATPPPAVAIGMFQVARCGDPDADEYFRRVAILYEQQNAILQTGTGAGVIEALVALGAEWGLSEAQIMASLADADGVERIRRTIQLAEADGVSGTPSFFLNGTLVSDPAFHTPEGLRRILDAA